MATLTFRVTGVCSGGNHYVLQVSGDVTRTLHIERSDIQDAEIDLDTMAMQILKVWSRGRTAQQIRTALQAGVTVML